jgi:hypothetical protein
MEDAMHEVVLKRFEKPDEIRTFEKGKFEMFYIPPGQDSWVVGSQLYGSLHLSGAADYAKPE